MFRDLEHVQLFQQNWLTISLALIIQLIPIDATVTEPWFYASMVPLLGIIGMVLKQWLPKRLNSNYVLVPVVIIIALLGIRTCLRGLDWRNETTLSYRDISASKEDYIAYIDVAHNLEEQDNYQDAAYYEQKSISIYPSQTGYSDLGVILTDEDKFPQALQAYEKSLQYGQLYGTYVDIGTLTLFDKPSQTSKDYLTSALKKYPDDSNLWLYLAILEQRLGDNTDAKLAIKNAANYGQIPPSIYNSILSNKPFNIEIAGEQIDVQ
jgi:tetratricopeptide (TPR) repeat protein